MAGTLDLSRYTLRFADEFNSLSLNDGTTGTTGTWTPDGYWGQRTLPANGERQFYVDPAYKDLGLDPFSLSDGALTISAQPASADVRAHIDNLDYTSGMITSEQSFSSQYGYFEMRAQLPEGQGLWPAFWLLTADGEWPPEYDVVEVLGHQPDKLYGTTHFEEGGGIERDHIDATPFDSSDGYHTYGFEWNQNEVIWYYDGVEAGRAENRVTDQPMYMIANLAVGGHWPGNPDGSTPFPAEMSIDYIRAYQLNPTHAAVGVPDDWAPIDPATAFTRLSGEGAPASWEWRSTMAAGQESVSLEGDWARYIEGNDGDNFIRGSDVSPYNEINGGRGNDTLEGRGGIDVFVVRNGDGNDTILDLSNTMGNTDKIRLDGFHFTHFNDLQPWLEQVGADVVLRLDQDQALMLRNTTVDALAPEQFVFTNTVAAPGGAAPVPPRSEPMPPPVPTPPVSPEPDAVEVPPQPEATPAPTPVVLAPVPTEPTPDPDVTGSIPDAPAPTPVEPEAAPTPVVAAPGPETPTPDAPSGEPTVTGSRPDTPAVPAQPAPTPVVLAPVPAEPTPDMPVVDPDVTGSIPDAPTPVEPAPAPTPVVLAPVPAEPTPDAPVVDPDVTGSIPDAPPPAPVVTLPDPVDEAEPTPVSVSPEPVDQPEPTPVSVSPDPAPLPPFQHEHEPAGHGDLLALLREAGFDLTAEAAAGQGFALGLGIGLGLGLTADGDLTEVEVARMREIGDGLRGLTAQGAADASAAFSAGNASSSDWTSLAASPDRAPAESFAFDTPPPSVDHLADLSSMQHCFENFAVH